MCSYFGAHGVYGFAASMLSYPQRWPGSLGEFILA